MANGPAASVLAATVARRYYLEGASKSEIAQELGLSRFKVARVLDHARSSGLVRIELHYEGEINLDLSVRLATGGFQLITVWQASQASLVCGWILGSLPWAIVPLWQLTQLPITSW